MQVVRNGYWKGKVVIYYCCVGFIWYVMLEEEEMKKILGMKKISKIVKYVN